MQYRNIRIEESEKLVKIHLESFKGFFLSSLGERFLNTYYRSCLKSNESIAICATDENEYLIGFSIGCQHSKGFHKRLIKKNVIAFMLQGIIILFSNPKAILRLGNNLGKNTDEKDDGNYAELLSIGVLPKHNGQGVGKGLIQRFEEEAILKGCKEITLTTDFNKNNKVLEFYKSRGYKVYYEFVTYPNRKMYKLKKNL